jgi:hypothetical protein
MHRHDTQSSQQYRNCSFLIDPLAALKHWENEGWSSYSRGNTDETCVKYIALVVLDAPQKNTCCHVKRWAMRGCQSMVRIKRIRILEKDDKRNTKREYNTDEKKL